MRKPPGPLAEDRYRTVHEEDMVRSLLIAALPYQLAAGERAKAHSIVTEALDDWIRSGLKFSRASGGERLFDPVEVFNHMKWEGLKGRDGFWSQHFIPTARAFTRQSTGVEGRLRGPLGQKRFSVALRRTFSIRSPVPKLRLRLPLPLASHTQDIDVRPISPEGMSASISRTEGRLEFQLEVKAPGSLEIGADLSFTANGAVQNSRIEALTSQERELYLRPAEGLIRVSPRIADLAATFAGMDTSLEVALNAWDFLLDELSCGMVRYDQVDPQAPGDWILDNGWYDCQLGSSLFIAICRARGIPARLMSGYMLYDLAPGYHYWSEIWQDGKGWLPFDLLSWDLSRGGCDLPWRSHFAGAIDYRMVTQCFPLAFTGPMTVRFPAAWHLLNAPIEGGIAIHFTALDGEPIYSDKIMTFGMPVGRIPQSLF